MGSAGKLKCNRSSDLYQGQSNSNCNIREKPETARQYDADGYRKRAACVCIRDEAEAEVLLVSSSSDPDFWVIPGGGVEACETATDAAMREVLEEAGVKVPSDCKDNTLHVGLQHFHGRIVRCLGMFENEDRKHRTIVFVLCVTDEFDVWDDASTLNRKRQWFSISAARHALGPQKLFQQAYLDRLKSQLTSCNPLPVSSSDSQACTDFK